MEKSAPQRESRIERTDRFWVSVATWRRERIRKTLIRPLYQEALKNLFLAAILLLDAFLPLQLYVSLPIPYNILGTLIALGILLYLEVKCYNAVWGKHGRWSLETYSLPLDQKKKEEETPQQEG
jgi:hypothetical protein